MRRYGDYKLGSKQKNHGMWWKLLVAAVVALLFWARYQYCHHPVINPTETPTPAKSGVERDHAENEP